MRYLRFLFLLLLLAGVLSSCGQTPTSPTLTPTPTLLPQARAYLTAALDIMQQHSVNRKTIDWSTLRQQAFARANGAETPADTYSAIRMALLALGDQHSSFIDPQVASQLKTEESTSNVEPDARLLSQSIGYLELLPFEGTNLAAMQRYVQTVQDAIRRIDQAGTCGWVVDLRINSGGNMSPRIAAVGPILGDGIALSFVGPDGFKQMWGYSNGYTQIDGSPTFVGTTNAYHLKHPMPPVAVLTGLATASAGEAIAIAFRGRPHTRSFGQPTYGLSTSNDAFSLSDGALLLLTVAVDADRTGKTYGGAIAPDEFVPGQIWQIGTPADRVLQVATAWLHEQEGC